MTSSSLGTRSRPQTKAHTSNQQSEAAIRRQRKREVKNFFAGMLYLAPALTIFIVFLFYPTFRTGWLSLFLTDIRGNVAVFNGIQNYIDIFQSATFLPSLWVSFLFAAMIVPATIISSLLLAVLASDKLRGMGFFRTTFAATLAVSAAAAAVVWRLLFHPSVGLLNQILAALGVPGVGWLTDPNWALLSVAITTVWMHLGFNFIVLLGGLQAVPEELYESARIDGAGRLRQLRSITVPMLSPVLFFVTIVLVIDSFQSFGQIDILTGGGPAGATNLIVYEIYSNAFTRNLWSFASAQAIILFILILILTALQFKIGEKKVHYQ